ncbi:hypothetical protein SAMN05444157_1629 [Frankineae bacterium MT45]|nr:hypothetical protein SAMN05444157_1629 [Frankineae bacterium MT45]
MTSSSDGVVTATLDPTTASVKLSVNWHTLHPTPSYVAITVFRTANGTTDVVRGMDSILAPGGVLNGIDHEAPLGVACTYSATENTPSTGAVLYTSTTATVTIAAPSPVAWLKHLMMPKLSQQVSINVMPTGDLDIQQGVFAQAGEEFPNVVQDVRQGETGTLGVKVTTLVQLTAMRALMKAAGPYLLQMPGYNEDDRYLAIGRISAPRVTWKPDDPRRNYLMEFTEVDRPPTFGATVSIPGRTLDDSLVAYPLVSNRSASTVIAKSA